MNIFSRYLIRNIFLGFAAAAALLLPLFTTFNLINELDDVSPAGYHWTQAVMVVAMTAPRSLIDLAPFIALLGGIAGMGLLSKSLELTAIRTVGFSIFRIGLVVLVAGALITLPLGVLDEWVASPLQQRALQMKSIAMAKDKDNTNPSNVLWAKKDNTFVTVKQLDAHLQPQGVEIFTYKPDLSLDSYIYARSATVQKDGKWLLQGVNQKRWLNREKKVESVNTLEWQSIFTGMSLEELTMPPDSFSIRQLNHYIRYLDDTGQPSIQYRIALWQKLGRPILTLAMILLAIPFTFVAPRSPGMGSRLAVGVIVGLVTYISYQIIVNLGLLLSLNVQFVAVLPPLLLLLLALWLVYRFDKHH